MNVINLKSCSLLIAVVVTFSLNGSTEAQINGGDLNAQITNAVQNGGGPATTGTTNTTVTTTGTTGGTAGGGGELGSPETIGTGIDAAVFDVGVEVMPNERELRGFIGGSVINADATILENGFEFVGHNELPPADNAGTIVNPPAPRGGRAAINVSDGIFVERTNPVRARLVSAFAAPRLAPRAVSNRFNQRVRTLPATQAFSNSMNVVMAGSTAVIRGTAQNREQLMRMARQLRLEPGVSRVVSQVSVGR